jgi:hypothetical protein
MKKLLIVLAFLATLCVSHTEAQWQVPDHAVPIGNGAGVTGFNNASPVTNGVLSSSSVLTDPIFTASPTVGTSITTPIVIGGTGAASSHTIESTSGIGTSDSILFKTGSQVTRWTIDTNGVAFFTPGTFTLYDGSSWAQTSVLRIANDLTAVGTGVAGSANQFALNVQVQIPSATSSGANYQKSAAIFGCQTADPSSATTRDCVGADSRAFITNTNATGRVWGGVDLAQINSGGTGDGILIGREIDIVNNGTDQANVNTTTSKYGMIIVPQVGNITSGLFLTNSGSGAYHHGIYMDPSVLASSGTANFITLNGRYTIDKNGTSVQTTTLSTVATFQSAGGGTMNFNFANTPATGAANDQVAVFTNFATTTGAQYNGTRILTNQDVATNGAQSTSIRLSNVNAGGALTENWRFQPSGGLSIGNGNIGTDPGAASLLATDLYSNNTNFAFRTKTALSNAAAAAAATLTNAPTAGNPTKWISIDDNGTTRRIPAW